MKGNETDMTGDEYREMYGRRHSAPNPNKLGNIIKIKCHNNESSILIDSFLKRIMMIKPKVNTTGVVVQNSNAFFFPPMQLLVTNALYFKGTWLHEFKPKQTHADCFSKDSGCRNVTMMKLDAELNYAFVDNLRAHALELPYEDNRYSMILLVPQDRDAGVALIRDLPYIGILEISRQLQPTDIILTMPKFTVEFSDDMVAVLKNMRITTLFTPDADISGIYADPRGSGQLNSIYHKVVIQVNEKDTSAAAAVAAGMVAPQTNSFVSQKIDRPFLFFIWDNENGVVLFEGKIEEATLGGFIDIHKKLDQETVNPSRSQIRIEQQFSIQPIVNQPVSGQPIPPTNQPISAQPIQPIVNQPVNGQPIQPTNQLTNQPIQPTHQPITTQTITEPHITSRNFKKIHGQKRN